MDAYNMRLIPTRLTTLSLLLGLLAALAPPTSARAADSVSITEWSVPYRNSMPRDPYLGGPDLVWFVGQLGDYVASFTPSSGKFRRFDLPAGTGPHTVIASRSGVWYAGNRAQHIGRLDAASGNIDRIMLPGDGARDPHTMGFSRDGNIWFTAQHANQIGYLDTRSRAIQLFDIATADARPYGLIVVNDRPWVTLFGTNKLATMDARGRLQEIDLPRREARPRRLAATPDGMIWYVDYAAGYLGRYNPANAAIDEWRLPGGSDSRPYAMAADKQGRLWLVATGVRPNLFIGFDPASQRFTEPIPIKSGGGTVRHMVYDEESNAIWFGTDTNTLGRAMLR